MFSHVLKFLIHEEYYACSHNTNMTQTGLPYSLLFLNVLNPFNPAIDLTGKVRRGRGEGGGALISYFGPEGYLFEGGCLS